MTIGERLREVAGVNAVRPDHEHERYMVAGATPLAVVMPESVDAMAATLAVCSEEGWPVEPAGAGTWLAAGRAPARPPVVVSTAALKRIREYEPADLVAGAEAGLPLAALQRELVRNRQTVVLDPPGEPDITLGAIVASASAGPLRAAHGTPRDMVLGAEVVTGDGRVLHFGGRVVKNVAGYDLVRLLVGSRGAFGIITSLFIRLRATTERDATFVAFLPSSAEVAALALEVRKRMEPDALEVISSGLTGMVMPDRGAPGDWAVLVRIRGSAAALDEGANRLRTIASSAFAELTSEIATSLWVSLSRWEAAASLCVRLADLPNRLPETLASASRLTDVISASDNNLPWEFAVHAADGIVRLWPAQAPPPSALKRLAERLPELGENYGTRRGTVSWPVWPTGAGVPCPEPGLPGSIELRLVRELKARFDPAGVLAVGRHLSGL